MLFLYYLLISYFFFIVIYFYKKDGLTSLFRYILKYLNYEVDNDVEYEIKQFPSKILIISSHTSIYDFIIGIIFYYGYLRKKYNTYILMKKDFEKITKNLLYYFDKKIKLISVLPNKNQGLTNQICEILENKDNYILYVAPEGTRSCTKELRKGYWVISKKLDIDVVYIGIDFSDKRISIEKNRKVMDEWEDEQIEFIKSCKKYVPLYPERCYWTKDYYI